MHISLTIVCLGSGHIILPIQSMQSEVNRSLLSTPENIMLLKQIPVLLGTISMNSYYT